MKRSIFMAVIGMAAGVASSYGQGNVVFSSYAAYPPNGVTTSQFVGGALIGTPYQAELFYALGTVSDPVSANAASITSDPSGLLPVGTLVGYDNSGQATGAAGLGFFDGSTVLIPGYTSGPITFEVVAFNGATYDTSSSRGRSGAFTMSSIAIAPAPAPNLGDNGAVWNNFSVAAVVAVPEPTTLALGALGLASLVAFRRKNV